MLYNCLIFLCIGVYASCKPLEDIIQTSIWEIQKDFCVIKNELDTHLHQSQEKDIVMPQDSAERLCARSNLNIYIKLLNQSLMNITMEKWVMHYDKMLNRLKSLAKAWPAESYKGNDMNCPTIEKSNLRLTSELHNFLLKALPTSVCLHGTFCPPHLSLNHSCSRKLEHSK